MSADLHHLMDHCPIWSDRVGGLGLHLDNLAWLWRSRQNRIDANVLHSLVDSVGNMMIGSFVNFPVRFEKVGWQGV